MIYIILALFISAYWAYKEFYPFDGLVQQILSFFFFLIGSSLLVFLISIVIWLITPSKYEFIEDGHQDIISINNGSSLEGSFTLGSGNINDREYYFTFVKSGEGFKREKFPMEGSLIIEGENESPKVTRKIFEESKPWWTGFWPFKFERRGEYNIHVPEGNIIFMSQRGLLLEILN